MSKLELTPLTIKDACLFISLHHRHHDPPPGGLFAVGVQRDHNVVGAAIIGRPIARLLDRGYTAELTRLCVLEDQPNASSMLYAASARAAKALGYREVITYTLTSESGVSLRAAGWEQLEDDTSGGSWNTPSRPRRDHHSLEPKRRWRRALTSSPE